MGGFTAQGDPSELGFTTMMTLGPDGMPTSVHRVPEEAFVHECDENAKCICGPHVVVNVMAAGPMPMVQHQPLYKSYYDEFGSPDVDFGVPFFDVDDADDDD